MSRDLTCSEDGSSLLELLVAMTIGTLVLALVMLALSSFLRNGYDGVAMGQANNQAALAITALRRQVVNADIVYEPTTTGSSLLLLTALHGTTTACVKWRLKPSTSQGLLQELSWPNGSSIPTGPWRTVATGIVNGTRTLNPTAAPVFALNPTAPAYGHRVLEVDFVLRQTAKKTSSTSMSLKSSITALDGQFYAPTAPQYCKAPST